MGNLTYDLSDSPGGEGAIIITFTEKFVTIKDSGNFHFAQENEYYYTASHKL